MNQHKLAINFRILGAQLVEATERRLSNLLNVEHADKAGGEFLVIIDVDFEPTLKGVLTYYWRDAILFYPRNIDKYAPLRKFQSADGWIDFSKVRNYGGIPSMITMKERRFLNNLLDEVFETIEEKGLIPLDYLVSEVLQSFGFKGSQLKKAYNAKPYVFSPSLLPEIINKLVKKLDIAD